MKLNSLRVRLTIIFAAIVIILISILSILIGQRSIHEVQSEIGDSLGEVAYLMGENLDQYMWSRYGEVKILSELRVFRDPKNLHDVENILNQLKQTVPSFSWVGFTNRDGKVMASTDGILRGVDISARPVYKEALHETFIGDVHEAVLLAKLLPNPTGESMKFVDISTPIYDYNERFVGVLATHLSWEWVKELEGLMKSTLHNREDVELFIVSKKNNHVILGPKELIGQPLQLKSIELARDSGKGWTLETWGDGRSYLTGYVFADGYKDYSGLNWTVLVRQPVEVAYAPAKQLISYFVMSGLALVVLFAFAGWVIAGQITKPLKHISDVADRLREGEDVEIPPYKGMVEIEILSDSLRKLVTNLTKTETALVKMENVAQRDNLTGLPNRNALDFYLEKATQKYDRLTILYLDLDGFKTVNDTWGHESGDQLLVQVGERLKQNVRSEELVARLGGDEFILVLIPTSNPEKSAKLVGERIISMINKPYLINGQSVSVGCSVGGALWSKREDQIGDVMLLADQALYKVKRTGKNRVHLHSSEDSSG